MTITRTMTRTMTKTGTGTGTISPTDDTDWTDYHRFSYYINGLNEIERNSRLRDFKVRCTMGLCPLISSLGKKTKEFALFQRKRISPKSLILRASVLSGWLNGERWAIYPPPPSLRSSSPLSQGDSQYGVYPSQVVINSPPETGGSTPQGGGGG